LGLVKDEKSRAKLLPKVKPLKNFGPIKAFSVSQVNVAVANEVKFMAKN